VDCFSDTGWLGVLTDAPVDGAGEVVRIVLEEVATLPERLERDEFERARDSHIARIRNDEVASPLEWAKYQAMSGYFLGRIPSVESAVRELEAVTFDEARTVAAEILRSDALVLTAGGPERAVEDCRLAFQSS
jgi:hypothetical protein